MTPIGKCAQTGLVGRPDWAQDESKAGKRPGADSVELAPAAESTMNRTYP
jgi:hypothetical protein